MDLEAAHGRDSEAADRLPTLAIAAPGLLIAEALARALRGEELHVVGAYVRLTALLEKIRRCRPDVVLVDAELRDSPHGAPDLLAQLVAAGPHSRIAVITAEVDRSLAREVTELGIHAVIMKSSPLVDAAGVLQHVANGRTSFPAAVLERPSERPDTRGLSDRQLEVLEELSKGRSNEEIARRLFISTNTVKFHLRMIYERLGVHNRVEASQFLATRRVVQEGGRGPIRRSSRPATPDGVQPSLRAIPSADRRT
jgi:DNA-binding NarL/FixJ family response regulator